MSEEGEVISAPTIEMEVDRSYIDGNGREWYIKEHLTGLNVPYTLQGAYSAYNEAVGTAYFDGNGRWWNAGKPEDDSFRNLVRRGHPTTGVVTEAPPPALPTQQNSSGIDLVNHPPHYTSHPSGVECIQITEHMNFNLGNAVKYLWRAGEKPGHDVKTELLKAIWYINREIERTS